MYPRKVENRSNRSNWVIVRNGLIKTKRIEKLTLVVIEAASSSIASTANRFRATESLFSRVANDSCNKIGPKRQTVERYRMSAFGGKAAVPQTSSDFAV